MAVRVECPSCSCVLVMRGRVAKGRVTCPRCGERAEVGARGVGETSNRPPGRLAGLLLGLAVLLAFFVGLGALSVYQRDAAIERARQDELGRLRREEDSLIGKLLELDNNLAALRGAMNGVERGAADELPRLAEINEQIGPLSREVNAVNEQLAGIRRHIDSLQAR